MSEARLWSAIKRRSTGVRFRRQVPIGFWIADFACLDPKLIIEVDDPSHDFRDETMRDDDLEERGFVVLRFTNKEVAQDIHAVVSTIESYLSPQRTE